MEEITMASVPASEEADGAGVALTAGAAQGPVPSPAAEEAEGLSRAQSQPEVPADRLPQAPPTASAGEGDASQPFRSNEGPPVSDTSPEEGADPLPGQEASPPAEPPPAAVPSDHAAPLPPEEAKEDEAAAEEDEPLPDFTDLLARYPGFDPATEGRDPAFTSLLAAGVAPDRAYEVLHLDQLLQGAMDYAARRTLERLAGANLAAAARPAENGLRPGSTATHSFDPRTLTPEQARDLRSRVYRGEKIYL